MLKMEAMVHFFIYNYGKMPFEALEGLKFLINHDGDKPILKIKNSVKQFV